MRDKPNILSPFLICGLAQIVWTQTRPANNRIDVPPKLKIVYGSDAVAGAHGRNAEDFINRVREGGIDPMSAMVSANWLSAEALNLADQIGSIAPACRPTSSGLTVTP